MDKKNTIITKKIFIAIVTIISWLYIENLTDILFYDTHLLSKTYLELILLKCIDIAIVLGLYIFLTKKLEKRNLTELSLKHLPKELSLGIILGILIGPLIYILLYFLGYFQINGTGNMTTKLLYGIVFGAVSPAILEELIFRGIILKNMESFFGTWNSLFISAILFGLIHLINANSTLFVSLNIGLTGGMTMGLIFVITKRIWIGVGGHFIWNATQLVLSLDGSSGLLESEIIEGPILITGGSYGVEGSIILLSMSLVVSVVLIKFFLKKNKAIQPYWIKN